MSVTDAPVKIAGDLQRESTPRGAVVFDVQNVGVSYDGNLAVHEVTLPIYEKQVTAIIGPSGCGKSTFIRVFNRMNDLIPTAKVHGNVLSRSRSTTTSRSGRVCSGGREAWTSVSSRR